MQCGPTETWLKIRLELTVETDANKKGQRKNANKKGQRKT